MAGGGGPTRACSPSPPPPPPPFLCLAAPCGWRAVAAKDGPAHPVRVVLPYPPGGASDATARWLGIALRQAWGESEVIDHRPGANGISANEAVAKAGADGYHGFPASQAKSLQAVHRTAFCTTQQRRAQWRHRASRNCNRCTRRRCSIPATPTRSSSTP